MLEKVKKILAEFAEIEKKMADPRVFSDVKKFKKVAQQKKFLEKKFALAQKFLEFSAQKIDAEKILAAEKDAEILEFAKNELEIAKKNLPEIEKNLRVEMVESDPDDEKNAILEIRPGSGGDESALFADEIFRMLLKFAEKKNFSTEILSENQNDGGGIKEIIFKVSGVGAYKFFKFEGGVHRVQRIPTTESKGRVHTSAVSVVVLPEIEETEFEINPADVRVDVFRSSGCGGQSVNTTDSAVRLTHAPSGIVVTCQDEKSQLKNKNKAFGVLRSRLAAIEKEKKMSALGEKKMSMIKSGDRSDKIRTYNFPQDRVTDHRIGQNFSNLQNILNGNLDKIFDALSIAEQNLK